tara:strand:- start:431 stop:1612 length:1182 start_codon:yes stop_codon:yes gene_type:complete
VIKLKDKFFIPYGKQTVTKNDIKAVTEVLQSDFLTQGPKVEEFEIKISSYTKSKYSVAVNSATSALHIACLSLGLKKGDILWTSPNTFVASSNCALHIGAKIDFVDINSEDFNIDIDRLEEKLKHAEKKKCLPKILIPVHLAGQPTIQERIYELSKKFGFKIIEDASHSIGASRKGEKVGSCRWSDITVFSFHPVKIITTAEGGIATTNNKQLYEKMCLFRSHGITKDKERFISKDFGDWHYEQQDLGFNFRMNDLQATLGISQLKNLDSFVSKRNDIADSYNRKLNSDLIKTPFVNNNNYSSFHLYVIRLKNERINKTHKDIFKNLRKSGIGVNLHYIPVHLHPYYKKLGFKEGDFPNAEDYAQSAISIPMFPGLKTKEQNKVIKIINEIVK